MQKYLVIVEATEWEQGRRFVVEGDRVEWDNYRWTVTRPGPDGSRIVSYVGDASSIVAHEFADSEQ